MDSPLPKIFAGLSFSPNGTLVVLETTHDYRFESFAQKAFLDLPITNTVPTNSRKLKFEIQKFSLSFLYQLRDKIMSQLSTDKTLKADHVVGVGINEGLSQVVVVCEGVPISKTAQIFNQLNKKYTQGAISVLVLPQAPVTLQATTALYWATRYKDTPFYNGDDQILTLHNGVSDVCTTGFGMHDTVTQKHFVSTAGHCGYDNVLINTFYNGEFFPNGSYLLSPDPNVGTTDPNFEFYDKQYPPNTVRPSVNRW